jgi:1,4-alpha-glucan branching enzyme
MEHPYFPSWGYQITGYFAASSRFGTPQDLMFLIDKFHQAGIGVILDWVPSHFPTDAHGPGWFDGTHLYEHADPQKGFHPDWQSFIFDYGRKEVRNFLFSNAMFWLEKYHADGLRVDAVASMIHLDYSREEGEWTPNKFGGNGYLEAIDFVKDLNMAIHREYPETVVIAEESTDWPGVTRDIEWDGLGFDQKWMMGWMNDTLEYFKIDPIFRKFHQNKITFSFTYAFSEKYMLPLSHDEVVHGKGTLFTRMPGDENQRFANLRLLFGIMWTHPGSNLLFMGGEFGQTTEWNIETGLEWHLLQYDGHKGVQKWVQKLNEFYKQESALFDKQFDYQTFEWVDGGDHEQSIVSFLRKGDDEKDTLLVACNFTPIVRQGYKLGVPSEGKWKEVLNSTDKQFFGDGLESNGVVKASKETQHGRPYSLELTLPALGIIVLKKQPDTLPKKKS